METIDKYYTINRGPHFVEDNINFKKNNIFSEFEAELEFLDNSLADIESPLANFFEKSQFSGSSAIIENASEALEPKDLPPYLKRSVYAPKDIFVEFANIDLSVGVDSKPLTSSSPMSWLSATAWG